MVERDLAKVDVAGSTPVSRSKFFSGGAPQPRGFFHPAIRRGTQVVRERSAKPLYVSSILTRASNLRSRRQLPSANQVAALTGRSRRTVIRLFENEPGLLVVLDNPVFSRQQIARQLFC